MYGVLEQRLVVYWCREKRSLTHGLQSLFGEMGGWGGFGGEASKVLYVCTVCMYVSTVHVCTEYIPSLQSVFELDGDARQGLAKGSLFSRLPANLSCSY